MLARQDDRAIAPPRVDHLLIANLINPGGTRTAMRAKAYPGENPETLPAPEEVAPLFVELASPECARNGEIVSFREWRSAKSRAT